MTFCERIQSTANLLCILAILSPVASGWADDITEIPVRGFFYASGKTRIEIEINPRDLNGTSAVRYQELQQLSEGEKQAMIDNAIAFVSKQIELIFEPSKGVEYPKYQAGFTARDGRPLKAPDDPVVIQLSWETYVPETAKTYQVKNKESGTLSVSPVNQINNQPVEPIQVLLPGENSDLLELPERISNEEIRSVMVKPIIFGIGLVVLLVLLRAFKRFV